MSITIHSAITYVFTGAMNHADNLGNKGTVQAGGAQRFTAGRGIIHSEFPDGHAAGSHLERKITTKLRGFVYAVRGKLIINNLPMRSGQAACIDNETSVQIHSHDGARLMWCFGLPHDEPFINMAHMWIDPEREKA